MTTKISNKGRITRFDQAWAAAHREAIERGRVHDFEEAETLAHVEHAERFPASTAVVTFMHTGTVVSGNHQHPATEVAGLPIPIKVAQAALIAAAKDDIRFYLKAVYIHAVDGEWRVVATDGHRLVASRFADPAGKVIPQWAADGILIPREELAQALATLAKNALPFEQSTLEPYFLLDVQGDTLRLTCANGFATFTLKAIDGKFPDYARVLAALGVTIARGDNETMRAAAIATEYLKGAADIASRLGATGVHAFISSSAETATFFTFAGAPDSCLVIMPQRHESEHVSDNVVRMLGKGGVEASVAAYRAHLTRTVTAIKSATGEERKRLEGKRDALEGKVAHLLTLTGPRQLEQKAA